MALTEEKLLELKGEIESAKTKVSELTGQKKILMNQLKETWGCKTLEEANKKLAEMNKSIKQLSEAISKQTAELEKKYDL